MPQEERFFQDIDDSHFREIVPAASTPYRNRHRYARPDLLFLRPEEQTHAVLASFCALNNPRSSAFIRG